MRKIALSLLVFLLICGGLALSAEEVQVPFNAVKSSCYGEIDMTKAEFLLSEIGKDCVMENWIKDNLSESDDQQKEPSRRVVDETDLPIKKEVWNKLPEDWKIRLRVHVCGEKMVDMAGWFFTRKVMNQVMGSEWVKENYESFREDLGWPERVPLYLVAADTSEEGVNRIWTSEFTFSQFGNTYGRHRYEVEETHETFSVTKPIDKGWRMFIAIPERIDISRAFKLCYGGFDFRCESGTTVVRKSCMDNNSAEIGPYDGIED